MFDARLEIKKRTWESHQALESQAVFSNIMSPAVCIADYVEFLAALARFLRAFEPALIDRLRGSGYDYLYRRRIGLLEADLLSLGSTLPAGLEAAPPPDSPNGLLGSVYAIEGSSIGGKIIARHCKKVIGTGLESSMLYLATLSPESDDGHWQLLLDVLRRNLKSLADVEEAAVGANRVFEGLFAAAGAGVHPLGKAA